MKNKKPKILHVDDEGLEGIFGLIKRILSDSEIIQFSKIEDALAILEKEDFDAYISDGLEGGWERVYGAVRSKELIQGKDYFEYKPFIVHTSNLSVVDKVKKDRAYDSKLGLVIKPNCFEIKNYLAELNNKK